MWVVSAYCDQWYWPSKMKETRGLPRAKIVNANLSRIINFHEIHSVVRPIKNWRKSLPKEVKRATLKNHLIKPQCYV